MQSQTIINFIILMFAGTLLSPALALAENGERIAHQETTLCDVDDIIIFSCTTCNDKIISLCGRMDSSDMSSAYYRFGRKNEIEMNFPEDKIENSFLHFSKSSYFRSLVYLQDVFFHNNGYSYKLYYEYREEDPEIGNVRQGGVVVSRTGFDEVLADIKCKSNYLVRFYEFNEKVKCEGIFCESN